MKFKHLAITLMFIGATFQLQAKVYVYWVTLKDKGHHEYTVNNPDVFLSEKAIERRVKNGIAVTEQDFPVNKEYYTLIDHIKGVEVWGASRWLNALMVVCKNDNQIIQIQRMDFVEKTELLGMPEKEDFERGEPSRQVSATENLQGAGKSEDEVNPTNDFGAGYYGEAFRQIEMLNGNTMHKQGFTGKGVTVAVIDAGFHKADRQHVFDKMYEEGRMLGTWDFVARDDKVYEDNNHGMAVLSCMAGYTVGKMVGTAPDASYYLLRTENIHFELPIEQALWLFAAEYADSTGCDVINSSLGYYSFHETAFNINYDAVDGKTTLVTQAANIAASKGMILCISAGNEGNSKWRQISVPADAQGILAVGAVDKDEKKARFSSYGPTSDGRVNPNVMSMGKKATVSSSTNTFYTSNGTSFASPILCGMVACLVQANPTAKSTDIIAAIEKSGDMYPKSNPGLGYGIPDFYIAHLMLGNAKDFDYTKTQVVEVNIGKDYAVYNIYSPVKQDVILHITRNGKEVYHNALTLGEKSFTKNVIDDNKHLTKGGDFVYTVKTADGKEIVSKSFSN